MILFNKNHIVRANILEKKTKMALFLFFKDTFAFLLSPLTESRHGLLALLHLLRHHAADAHQILRDVTGCLSQALFGHLSAGKQYGQW